MLLSRGLVVSFHFSQLLVFASSHSLIQELLPLWDMLTTELCKPHDSLARRNIGQETTTSSS